MLQFWFGRIKYIWLGSSLDITSNVLPMSSVAIDNTSCDVSIKSCFGLQGFGNKASIHGK